MTYLSIGFREVASMHLFPPLDDGRGRSGPESALGTLLGGHEKQIGADFECFAEDTVLLGSALLLFGSDRSGVDRSGDNGVFRVESGKMLGELLGEVDTDKCQR